MDLLFIWDGGFPEILRPKLKMTCPSLYWEIEIVMVL